MKNMAKIITIGQLIAILVSGCSTKDIYNDIQRNAQRACEKEPPARYEECLKEYDQPYESYKNARDELLNDQSI